MSTARVLPAFRPAGAPGVPECFIANARPGQQALVAVHGISRNAAEIAMRFAAHPAFARVTVIAPLFDRKAFGRYQQLAVRDSAQTPSDSGLIALLEALAAEGVVLPGPVRLFGFSGGAQMAHRFAMFHPERVARLCISSAGWYCLPRSDLAWPYGLGEGAGRPAVGPGFLDIATTVLVGSRDTRIDSSVRQDPVVVEHQGHNRLRRARNFVRAMNQFAQAQGHPGRARLVTMPGVSHEFAQCVEEGNLIDIAAQALL